MSKKEKETKEKKDIRVISSDTSVKLPDEKIDDKEAVKELLQILKPKVTAPKPISPKPITLTPKPITPIKTPVIEAKPPAPILKKSIEIPSQETTVTPATTEEETDIIVTDKIEEEEVSEDLVKMSSILKELKEEEIAVKEEEAQKIIEIPEIKAMGIYVECPHCGRKILLDKLEYLKQGYSDYCPFCDLMLLPNILPDDYKPQEKETSTQEDETPPEE